MLGAHRVRVLIGAAAAVGVVAFAVHAGAQAPSPGRYISWAPPATATATPGAGPALPVASAAPEVDTNPLGGLTTPLSGLFKQLNTNTAATATGQYSLIQDLETALARIHPAKRAALTLCFAAGYTHEEASKIMDIPLGTLKSHVLRGREEVQAMLTAWKEPS